MKRYVEVDKAFPFSEIQSSMPSVGTRRSTRVFVPKSVVKSSDSDGVRVLRSGKRRLSLESGAEKPEGEKDEWLRLIENPRRDASDAANFRVWKGENGWIDQAAAPAECDNITIDAGGETAASDLAGIVDRDRMCGIVYNRKRRRLPEARVLEARVLKDRMYGIPFVRKHRRKNLFRTLRAGIVERNKECEIAEIVTNSHNFVRRRVFLIGFIEYSSVSSFFLGLVFGWMRRWRLRMSELADFLSSESIARVFSTNGVRFLAVRRSENHLSYSTSCRDAFPAAGICTIFGARRFVPLVSLNFAAAPLYFMSLFWVVLLGSQYLPGILARYLARPFENTSLDIGSEQSDPCISTVMDISRIEIAGSGSLAVTRRALDFTAELTELAGQNAAVQHSVRSRKHQKRRSSMRSARVPKRLLTTLSNGGLHSKVSGLLKFGSAAKVSPIEDGLAVPIREKSLDMCGDFFGIRDDYAVLSSPRTNHRRRKSTRTSSVEKIKELKSFSIDLKQNIDSLCCSANILVIESDRCWRECGAEVVLEYSGSKEKWLLAVKAQGSTRYLHKAQEMRPSATNRYTHAMIWTGESGWKLEFCDRKDWFVFKELHRECREKNTQGATVRIIPVPGIREVSGYGDGDAVPFVRPDVYITTADDEIGRALMSKNANYDLDSVDEEWLEQLNCKFHDSDGSAGHISEDNFEKIIYSFEKAAYTHPNDVFDENRATSLCPDLGTRDMVVSVYEYWLRKKEEKKSSLVRVFEAFQGQPPNKAEQGQPPKRAQLIQQPFFRKKRSFKRQASHFGRGKPESFSQAPDKQEAIKRVQEAEHAVNRAVEIALVKRRKAQMLMQNAELVTYKSIVALKIAQAAEESLEVVSMVLD
ncbi:uncharacterized protein LOC143863774 isoform X2 [Tasmannia lanceolata]|uniref:uncharacterized protein LOC143863774 isoform X2 n=1 Tax=Tasmannia lanceolata TaxID=3420 RepID=UPI004063ECF0